MSDDDKHVAEMLRQAELLVARAYSFGAAIGYGHQILASMAEAMQALESVQKDLA
jgi:hypothetical protein